MQLHELLWNILSSTAALRPQKYLPAGLDERFAERKYQARCIPSDVHHRQRRSRRKNVYSILRSVDQDVFVFITSSIFSELIASRNHVAAIIFNLLASFSGFSSEKRANPSLDRATRAHMPAGKKSIPFGLIYMGLLIIHGSRAETVCGGGMRALRTRRQIAHRVHRTHSALPPSLARKRIAECSTTSLQRAIQLHRRTDVPISLAERVSPRPNTGAKRLAN